MPGRSGEITKMVLLSLLVTLALGGCATPEQMPEACRMSELDATFQRVNGEPRDRLLEELSIALDAASVRKFDLKGSRQFLARSDNRAIVCELSACTAASWIFERVQDRWVHRSYTPAICVVH